MTYCRQCGRPIVPGRLRPANDNERPGPTIHVASDAELRRNTYFYRMAMATAAWMAEPGHSRRLFPDWMADVIYLYEGDIVWPHAGHFEISDTAIDDVFNDDGSFRWLSSFVAFAEEPPRQAPQMRIVPRLRLISLAFQINRPDIARQFRR